MKPKLSVEQLRSLLSYDKDTGLFVWKVSRGTKKHGSHAGSIGNHGYVVIGINGFIYVAHRIAWSFEYGAMPDQFIDHINGNKTDNRIANLRLVNKTLNSENQRRAHADNATGLLGVTFMKKLGKYQAQIMHQGKVKYLGIYEESEQAHQVYLAEKRAIHSGCTI